MLLLNVLINILDELGGILDMEMPCHLLGKSITKQNTYQAPTI